MNRDEVLRLIETNRIDRRYMDFKMTAEEYRAAIKALGEWAELNEISAQLNAALAEEKSQ